MHLTEVFLEQRPVVGFPTLCKMIAQFLRETLVVENQMSARPVRSQLKPRNRIDAFGPIDDAPCLNDSLIGNEFEVPADDVAVEQRKRSADFAIDLGCSAGEQ